MSSTNTNTQLRKPDPNYSERARSEGLWNDNHKCAIAQA